MPKHDAAILRRMREGDTRIPPQEFRDLMATRNGRGASRVTAIIRKSLTEGERPQRRKAVSALTVLVEGLAGGDDRLTIPTERCMAQWAAQAIKDERDDTP